MNFISDLVNQGIIPKFIIPSGFAFNKGLFDGIVIVIIILLLNIKT